MQEAFGKPLHSIETLDSTPIARMVRGRRWENHVEKIIWAHSKAAVGQAPGIIHWCEWGATKMLSD